jgi:hypothetical protein
MSNKNRRKLEDRKEAMMAIVGIWKDRPEFADPVNYVRNLRGDTRLRRLYKDEPARLRRFGWC